jgi:hypothetical protein
LLPSAAQRGERNRMVYPDTIGIGRFGLCDKKARRLVLGLD